MTYLPRHETDDVATRADIARLEAPFDRLESRLDSRLDQLQLTYVVTTVGSMTALTAIFWLVVSFLA